MEVRTAGRGTGRGQVSPPLLCVLLCCDGDSEVPVRGMAFCRPGSQSNLITVTVFHN